MIFVFEMRKKCVVEVKIIDIYQIQDRFSILDFVSVTLRWKVIFPSSVVFLN
jgi:ferredoxin-fold anticodon binding domain-containing protein